jgi:glycosyltransferase involved in cell wall biosynthesis
MKIQNGKSGNHRSAKKFYYKNILLVGSILHAGNSVEYFKQNTEKLVVFYFLGTLREEKDFIQVYESGKLINTKIIHAPRTPLIYHAYIYLAYLRSLIKNFSHKDNIYVISFHPLFFIGNKFIRLFRNIIPVFWIADFLPKPSSIFLKFYQRVIMYYHKRNKINFYLGDKLNKLMNGKILRTKISRTVMWGILLDENNTVKVPKRYDLCFIGVVRKGHGLDFAFKLLQKHKSLTIKILGECEGSLFSHYQSLIKSYGIEKRVKFENRYYKNKELQKEISSCSIGIGLYDTSKDDPIYYTDPGKIKTYTQFGLPIIMTNTSEIVPYINKFKAGEITGQSVDSFYNCVNKIKKNYQKYLKGVDNFNTYFEYNRYYNEAFRILKD